MIIRICAFTDNGWKLAEKIEEMLPEHLVESRDRAPGSAGTDLKEWTREAFEIHAPVIFVGACGIAVRSVAPWVRDKLTDSPVLVVDEAGQFVIPILSGHVGGANRLAVQLAESLGAQAVITTATDVNGAYAVDEFAVDNGLEIMNRDGIKKVSGKLLAGEDMSGDVVITDDPEEGAGAVLWLRPRRYILGIGCKRGVGAEAVESLACKALEKAGADWSDVAAVATIDMKSRERGLLYFTGRHRLRLKTFTAEELAQVPGDFTESEFVKQVTGVSNVCERAAMCLAGPEGRLVVSKLAENGVTAALAVRGGELPVWKK